MNYKIVADSTANITELKDIPFESVPLKITVGDNEYIDNENVDLAGMINHLKTYKGKSGTACPSPQEYIDAFGEAKYVFCVVITNALSGSCNSARLAREEYETANPERKVFVIDTLSTGPENGLIIEKLCQLIKEGRTFEDICEEITEYLKHTHLIFSLESLMNLANNGRVSYSVAKIAGLLGIRLIGKASDHGTLEPTNKARGEKKAIDVLFKSMQNLEYKGGKVIINHCEGEANAQKLKEMILTSYPDADIKIYPNRALCSYYAEVGGLLVGFEDI